jgi:hypothetical protein
MRKTFLALLLSGVLAPAMVSAETADAGTPDAPPARSSSQHAMAENDEGPTGYSSDPNGNMGNEGRTAKPAAPSDADSNANMPPPNSKDAAHQRQSGSSDTGAQGTNGSNSSDQDKSDSDKSNRKNTAPPAQDPSRTPSPYTGSQGGSSPNP